MAGKRNTLKRLVTYAWELCYSISPWQGMQRKLPCVSMWKQLFPCHALFCPLSRWWSPGVGALSSVPGIIESMNPYQCTIYSRCNFYLIIATVPDTENQFYWYCYCYWNYYYFYHQYLSEEDRANQGILFPFYS